MQWKITNHENGLLLRDYLHEQRQFSRRLLKRVKANQDGLLVNGEPKTVRYRLQTGDIVQVRFPEEERSAYILPENIPLRIIYEDEHLLVIHKPAGMPSMPSKLHVDGTLANGLLHYYDQTNIPYTIHIVTRLDKNTSGLVLVAKHQYCHSLLSNLQRQKEIERTYLAIVHGKLNHLQGTIDRPIARNPHSIIERMVCDTGKRAVTYYEVEEEGKDHSLVRIKLGTGRTHQIRVHFSYLGHPLVGDDLYGGKTDMLDRQALHCASIGFYHPFTEEMMSFSVDLPADMKNLQDTYHVI